MPIEPGINLTKETILSKVTQEQIFEAYLGLPVDTGTSYINPLRVDKRPGCRYYYNALGKLYFHDFGKNHWDCFAVVQYKFACTFAECLKIIVKDFSLNHLSSTNNVVKYIPETKIREVIKVSVRDWNDKDIEYWAQYNISPTILKIGNVYPCKSVWINDEHYKIKSIDPCYCYYFGNNMYKLYFPFRDYNRFFQNIHLSDNTLQGFHLLPASGPYLVLTKSYKDVLSLYSFGIVSAAVLSEYHLIKEELYEHLLSRFPLIVTLFDNDETGRKLTIKYINKYRTPYLLFPIGSFAKDFSDNVKRFGVDKMNEICKLKLSTI